jgi:hypothetical protein
MTVVMERPVDQLGAEAGRIAAANPPSRVVAVAVLGLLTGIGWLIGRTWFFIAKGVVFAALGIRYGYRLGAKVPVEAKAAG